MKENCFFIKKHGTTPLKSFMKTKILSPEIYGHCPRKIGQPRKPAETSSTQHSNLTYQKTNPNGALPSKLLKRRWLKDPAEMLATTTHLNIMTMMKSVMDLIWKKLRLNTHFKYTPRNTANPNSTTTSVMTFSSLLIPPLQKEITYIFKVHIYLSYSYIKLNRCADGTLDPTNWIR